MGCIGSKPSPEKEPSSTEEEKPSKKRLSLKQQLSRKLSKEASLTKEPSLAKEPSLIKREPSQRREASQRKSKDRTSACENSPKTDEKEEPATGADLVNIIINENYVESIEDSRSKSEKEKYANGMPRTPSPSLRRRSGEVQTRGRSLGFGAIFQNSLQSFEIVYNLSKSCLSVSLKLFYKGKSPIMQRRRMSEGNQKKVFNFSQLTIFLSHLIIC